MCIPSSTSGTKSGLNDSKTVMQQSQSNAAVTKFNGPDSGEVRQNHFVLAWNPGVITSCSHILMPEFSSCQYFSLFYMFSSSPHPARSPENKSRPTGTIQTMHPGATSPPVPFSTRSFCSHFVPCALSLSCSLSLWPSTFNPSARHGAIGCTCAEGAETQSLSFSANVCEGYTVVLLLHGSK